MAVAWSNISCINHKVQKDYERIGFEHRNEFRRNPSEIAVNKHRWVKGFKSTDWPRWQLIDDVRRTQATSTARIWPDLQCPCVSLRNGGGRFQIRLFKIQLQNSPLMHSLLQLPCDFRSEQILPSPVSPSPAFSSRPVLFSCQFSLEPFRFLFFPFQNCACFFFSS